MPPLGSFSELFTFFPLRIMDDTQNTIGLSELLAEVDRDLDEFRKKHQSDFGVKNVTLWWELERERLVTRHGSLAAVKKLRKIQGIKRTMIWFFAGWVTMLAASTVIRLLLP